MGVQRFSFLVRAVLLPFSELLCGTSKESRAQHPQPGSRPGSPSHTQLRDFPTVLIAHRRGLRLTHFSRCPTGICPLPSAPSRCIPISLPLLGQVHPASSSTLGSLLPRSPPGCLLLCLCLPPSSVTNGRVLLSSF